ncbi:MAG: 3-phosphoshikimate 1-carboxyvinyltransferase [Oscillospiraceae bacterium]|nr:3-phosphoshikimate 1-carboxyvinyltransferase [Oscillospiraceae bacterium]
MQDLKNIKINPGYKTGTVSVPSSKSIAHRALICAALAKEQSNIYGIDYSDDINATIEALKIIKKNKQPIINCKESGSTLRFLIPVAAALEITATFTGEGKLPERPVDLYQDLFKDKGVFMEFTNNKLPVKISGKLSAGKFYILGNISSQFITGLILALPILDEDSEIILISPLESKPYVDMTVDVLKRFDIKIDKTPDGYYIKGNQNYQSADYTVEGDFSQAAFFACAGAINGDITIKNLNPNSLQGDYKIIDILNEFGAKVFFDGEDLKAVKCENLRGIKIDASQIPDLVPVLSVVGAYAKGETVIYNAGRLRLKESDRIRATCEMLKSIGANIKETDDGMIINGTGGKKLPGGLVKSFNDHRIAMSAAVAGIWTENGVVIDDMGCINKSYPMFLRDFKGLK